MKKILIASLVATVILAAQAHATNIVFYSFNVSPQAPVTTAAGTNTLITANIGSSLSGFTNVNSGGGFQTLTILSSVSTSPNNHGFAAGNSVSQNGWDGNNSYFQFTLNASGYQDVVLTWTGNVSGTGPATNGLWYSTDGGSSFNLFSTFRGADNNATVGIVTQDLTSVTSLNNNSLDIFRIYGTNVTGAAIVAGGTMKIDNFAIDANVIVPEPSTIMLVGVGVLGMFAIRRRRSVK